MEFPRDEWYVLSDCVGELTISDDRVITLALVDTQRVFEWGAVAVDKDGYAQVKVIGNLVMGKVSAPKSGMRYRLYPVVRSSWPNITEEEKLNPP